MNTQFIISGIVSAAIILAVKLILNLRKWDINNPIPVDHGKEWKVVAFFMVIPGLCFLYPYFPTIEQGNAWVFILRCFLYMIIVAGMLIFWVWNLFDGLYNVLRGQNWWFVGSDDVGKHQDAKSDDFLQSLLPWQCIAIKLGGLILFTGAYYLTL